jgi:protein TonB
MTALRLPWFEDEDPRDLRRWAVAAVVVLGVHVGAIGLYAYLHQPEEIGDDTSPITVDLTPSDDTIAQPEVAPVPESQPVVTLNFRVNRDGRVLAREIVRSSGHPELDKEVISMIERAQPLPPFPPSMPEDQLALTVPIRFSLR